MKKGCLSLVVAALIAFWGPAQAQQGAEQIFKAVVSLRSTVPDSARTARILGTEREGNGVVIDSNGLILTIGYLILEASDIEITGPDGKSMKAAFVGYDSRTGFGLLRAAKPLKEPPIKLGKSSEVTENTPVLVVGHGGSESVLGARVISRREFAGNWEYLLEDAIFTTPPHPGFGGAALLGRDGRLLGIGSLFLQVELPGLGVIPSNMFVPIDSLKPIMADLISMGHSSEPPRPWLGLNAGETQGRVFILRITSEGPAEKAGLKPGDIVLEVLNRPVEGLADFFRKVWGLGKAGVNVPMSVLQGTQIRQIIVRSGDRSQYFK